MLVAGEQEMDDKIRYWLDIAEYDLTTAVAMLDTEGAFTSALCAIRLLRRLSKHIISW